MNFFKRFGCIVCWLLTVFLVHVPGAQAGEMLFKPGQRVAFLGDSITAQGWSLPGGYIRLAVTALDANEVKITPQPAGIGGHTSRSMFQRIQGVLAEKPTWITISCGVNDVWRPVANGVSLDKFKQAVTGMADLSDAAGVKVILFTATPIMEDLDNEKNQRLVAYNDFLRELAKTRGYPLADMNAAFQAAHKAAAPHKGNLFTVDGVHMNVAGNLVMAETLLRTVGLSEAQIGQARERWLDLPAAASMEFKYPGNPGKTDPVLVVTAAVSMRESERLKAVAAKEHLDGARAWLGRFFLTEVKTFFVPQGPYADLPALFASKKDREVQALLQARMDAFVKASLSQK